MRKMLTSTILVVLLMMFAFILTGCSNEKMSQDTNELEVNKSQVHLQPIWIPSTNGRLQMILIPQIY